jgi:glycosyltransferase involved in cell wall biosynthesis
MSFKGLHVLFDAIAILKKRYNQIKLIIAGTVLSGIRQSGYEKWLKKKIKQIAIDQNVFWIGPLDAKNLVVQMYQANVFVVPSFVETYCLAFDEALTIGVPSVASFAGAMPELATHEKTALFFPPGDIIMCADSIERLFEYRAYAELISQNAYDSKKLKTNKKIVNRQLSIYNSVLQANGII